MSILAKEIWNQKLFNGSWQPAQATYNVVEVATGQGLGEIGAVCTAVMAVETSSTSKNCPATVFGH